MTFEEWYGVVGIAYYIDKSDYEMNKVTWHVALSQNDKIIKEHEKEIYSLREEIKYLRYYGNKDCTAQADEARNAGEIPR